MMCSLPPDWAGHSGCHLQAAGPPKGGGAEAARWPCFTGIFATNVTCLLLLFTTNKTNNNNNNKKQNNVGHNQQLDNAWW